MASLTAPKTHEWTPEQTAAARATLGAISATDYASQKNKTAGVIKVGYGLSQNENVNSADFGSVNINAATAGHIDEKNQAYNPIVPKMLDYAVMKALTEPLKHDWTDTEKAAARNTIGAVAMPTTAPTRGSILSTRLHGDTWITAWTSLVHDSTLAWTVPCRDANGCIKVANPIADLDAVNLATLNNTVGDIESALDSILAIQNNILGGN